jgi:hypothetical protein
MTHVPGLNDEQVAVYELEKDPDDVDDVVLPSDVFEGDRIYILVEDEGEGDDKVEDVESLGADREREDFDSVGDDEWGEGNIVEPVEQEDKGDDGVTSCFVLMNGVLGRTDGLEQEHDKHARGGGQATCGIRK